MKALYIDIDSLRPDHLRSYGYSRETAPNISRLAQEGVRFENCYVSDSPCMASRASTISGRFGIKNGIVTHGDRGEKMNLDTPTLPLLLRDSGIKTCAISTFGRHPSPWFYVGWEDFKDPAGWNFQQTPAWRVNELAVDWIEQNKDEDFFLWVQFWDVHAVYDPPKSCEEAVKDGNYPAYPTSEEIAERQGDDFWHCAPMMGIHSYEDFKEMIDLYDAEIRYVDHHIGLLLNKLESLGIMDETLIIVSADHGEELGEHGVFVEHWSTYDGTSKVPLIMRHPQTLPRGQVRKELVYQMDMSATLLEFFGVGRPLNWDSSSLLSGHARPYLVCGHGLYTAQRAVVTDEWKLIKTMNPGMWELPEYQLFDRTHDPYERHSLHETRLEVVGKLNVLLTEWEEAHQQSDDPMVVNARLGPPGIELYGQETMSAFRTGRTPMSIVKEHRKPEIHVVSR